MEACWGACAEGGVAIYVDSVGGWWISWCLVHVGVLVSGNSLGSVLTLCVCVKLGV